MKTRATILVVLLLLTAANVAAQTTAEDYYKLAIESFRIRDAESVLLYLNKAIELDPVYTDAYMLRASNLRNRRNYHGAIADYTKVIELGRKKVVAYEERALTYHYNNDQDAAIADYAKVIELGGNKRVAYFFTAAAYEYKAWNLIQRGDVEPGKAERAKAIDAYTRSIAIAPDDPAYTLAYSYRSICHSRNKDYGRALADINIALKLKPDFVDDLYRRLDIYRATGQKELAAADEQRIFELTGKRPK